MKSTPVEIGLLDPLPDDGFQIKDPSVVRMADGTFLMYATVFTRKEHYRIGRFEAKHPRGPWHELSRIRHDIAGSEVCAPSMRLRERDDERLWTMYVQTACFQENGRIEKAVSSDGVHFLCALAAVMSVADVPAFPESALAGLYDVSVSDIRWKGVDYECMVFSGYRRVGCGDLYLSMRVKADAETKWQKPRLLLRQEDVPFHNRPDSPNFEWGLEGAKLIQVSDDFFAVVGVCFLDKGPEHRGSRQRVFMAGGSSPMHPFRLMTLPIEPIPAQGENGHPDTIDMGNSIGLLYQERDGDGKPWYLRYREYSKAAFRLLMQPLPVPANDPLPLLRPAATPMPATV